MTKSGPPASPFDTGGSLDPRCVLWSICNGIDGVMSDARSDTEVLGRSSGTSGRGCIE